MLNGQNVEALSEGTLPVGDLWPRPRQSTSDTASTRHRSVYCVATDDEIYGGVWRPLFTESLGHMTRPVLTLTTRPATTLPHVPRGAVGGD